MRVNIIGAGLAGLSAAYTLARQGVSCALVSRQQSERAQSVMAEGGINAALNTMGEGDSVRLHIEDTLRGGVNLADPNAVEGLCRSAPEVVQALARLGVPFGENEQGIELRSFGGQRKKRTAFVKSSTGKMLMTALIDAVRRYEKDGLVKRYPHHRLESLETENGRLTGVKISDEYSGRIIRLGGRTILCAGGMNGLFEGLTTGTTQNTSDVAALCLDSGVELANLEFIQYHPTTIGISGKRLLISEAARGEGGRLYILRNGSPWYFMEEKYPELGNLMPRDVVSAEMVRVCAREDCAPQVYLDMTALPQSVWKTRLSDLREQCVHYLSIDPAKVPVPVSPGIHFFMGGIWVDESHRTSLNGLYAAGECACQYHGANRLGGNSLLGAVYGGQKAAEALLAQSKTEINLRFDEADGTPYEEVRPRVSAQITELLYSCLKILRTEEELLAAKEKLQAMSAEPLNAAERRRLNLALATVGCALFRTESRGAHKRLDYPEANPSLARQTVVKRENNETKIFYRDIPERRTEDVKG